ncbi:hypothetical protein H8959_012223, partial [Pygathrix nigripes]
KINAKLHDGVCQRCKEVLEWRVKYSKYKPLTKPKKCVKCLQKTVKDSYHIMCRPCACELEVCAKCGKKEDIVIPLNKETEKIEHIENNLSSNHRRSCRRNEESEETASIRIPQQASPSAKIHLSSQSWNQVNLKLLDGSKRKKPGDRIPITLKEQKQTPPMKTFIQESQACYSQCLILVEL